MAQTFSFSLCQVLKGHLSRALQLYSFIALGAAPWQNVPERQEVVYNEDLHRKMAKFNLASLFVDIC